MSPLIVLEARIHQLQSTDLLLDVQRSKVQFVKAPSSGKGTSSEKGSLSILQEINAITKSRQMVAKGTHPSRWMKKLTEEKKKKLKILQHLQQKIQKTHEKPALPSNYKNVKSSSMQPATSFKTITSASKQKLPLNKKSKGRTSLANEIRAAVSATNISTVNTAAAGTAAQQHNVAKGKSKRTENVSDAEARAKELLEVKEPEGRLNHQEKQSTTSSKTQELQEDKERIECSDLHLSIRSYLEACWFAGATERAHNFLLSQHRVRRRRKLLNTDVYNIIMRVWAKKVHLPLNILSSCGVCQRKAFSHCN